MNVTGTKQIKVINIVEKTLVFSIFMIILVSPSTAQDSLIILNSSDSPTMLQNVKYIESIGGKVTHRFPPHILIGDIPSGQMNNLTGHLNIEEISTNPVNEASVSRYGRTAEIAAEVWNNNYIGKAAEAGLISTNTTNPGPILGDMLFVPENATLSRNGNFLLKSANMISELPAQTIPYGAGFYDTSAYMIGDVAVGIIFLESNGVMDPNSEDWTIAEESNVVSEIQAGLNWWIAREPNAKLTFTYNIPINVPTRYEPIQHPSSDESLWITDAMTDLGYTEDSYYLNNVRDFDNSIRGTLNTDWAFTIFVVDSSNDADGKFSDGKFAYAFLGGPFMVMTYGNDGWGIANMDSVAAHELGHIFYALDQYYDAQEPCTKRSGYLNIENQNSLYGSCSSNVPSIMRSELLSSTNIDSYARQQIGWRDTDADGILDIIDFPPTSTLNAYSPDPTNNKASTYTGRSTSLTTYPNTNPYMGNDITINKISGVNFSVDGGEWANALPTDGLFNSFSEDFTFTAPTLSDGTHTIYVLAQNTGGNGDTFYATDTLTIDAIAPTVTINQAGGQSDPTGTAPINFTVMFSESVSDFATGNVTLGGTAGATTATVTGSGTTYNVAVTGMTGSGTVTASIPEGAAHDEAGNANNASSSTDNNVTYATPPESISFLHLRTHSDAYINWSWINPDDADFNYTMVYIDGIFQANISSPINYYNTTGLTPDANYNISTHTVNIYGIINSTWINNTGKSTYSNLKIRGWGWNNNGQVGDGTIIARDKPVDISELSDISSIAGGGEHTVALRKDGTVWAWGSNNHGQLGDNTATQISEPILVNNIGNVKNISAGGYNTLALKSDGTVWSWGYNYFGQLGDNTLNDRNTPLQVNGVSGVTNIASGAYHSIALKSDGTVWTWGGNDAGQLGDGTTTNKTTPIQANGISNVKAIAGGKSHTIALKNDGTVWAWGNNECGQLGDGTTANKTTAVKVTGISGVTAIAAGTFHSIALMSNGTVWTWGDNSMGQLGDGSIESKKVPVKVNGVHNITAISGGHGHTLALDSSGSLWVWGYNQFGQLGDDSTTDRNDPYLLNGFSDIVGITGGWFHTIAIYGDLTPPASITNINNTTYALNYINWTWINPENIDFSKVMIYLNGSFDINITPPINYYNRTGLSPGTQYTISTHTVDIYGNINSTWVNHTVKTAPDTAPPASITNLTNTTYALFYINWTWNNPNDTDFASVMIYLNGTFKINVTSPVNYSNLTGLIPGMQYNLSTRTVDIYGNINSTWVNHTAITAPDIAPPASITNLTNTTYAMTRINWTWKNPADTDFNHTIVYINGIFRTNISSSLNYYFLTGLDSDTWYNISTHTVDIYGNINSTWVNHSTITDTKYGIPAIIGFAPVSPINNYYGTPGIFNITTNKTVNVTWYLNNIKVQTNESVLDALYANGNESSGTWIVNATANNTFGTVSQEWIWTVIEPSNPPNNNLGGGGGGGGGASSENYSNIEVIEKYDLYIYKDRITSYRFIDKRNPVLFINITGYVTAGEVNAAVEVLKNKSTISRITTKKAVYKFFNIWLGRFLFAEPRNIKEGEIIFRVENEWINSIHSNSITLNRVDADWVELVTQKIYEDEKYTYYRANSQKFSTNFAITASDILSEQEDFHADEPLNKIAPTMIFPDHVYDSPDKEMKPEERKTEKEDKELVAKTSGIDYKITLLLVFAIVFLLKRKYKRNI